jgi:hypothetical protein
VGVQELPQTLNPEPRTHEVRVQALPQPVQALDSPSTEACIPNLLSQLCFPPCECQQEKPRKYRSSRFTSHPLFHKVHLQYEVHAQHTSPTLERADTPVEPPGWRAPRDRVLSSLVPLAMWLSCVMSHILKRSTR